MLGADASACLADTIVNKGLNAIAQLCAEFVTKHVQMQILVANVSESRDVNPIAPVSQALLHAGHHFVESMNGHRDVVHEAVAVLEDGCAQ